VVKGILGVTTTPSISTRYECSIKVNGVLRGGA
jgi:hypothetical protein